MSPGLRRAPFVVMAALACMPAAAQDVRPGPAGVVADSLQRAQLEKLRLEIATLQRAALEAAERSWPRRVEPYLPLLTMLVSVAGALAALTRFLNDRQVTRRRRLEEEFRADLQELVAFPSAESGGAAHVSFLLQDLRQLTTQLEQRVADVTTILVELAIRDLDFGNPRHVILETAAMERWTPYREFLARNPSEHQVILVNYVDAVRRIHAEHPAFFERLEYRAGMFVLSTFVEHATYRRFIALLDAVALHVPLLEAKPELRTYVRERFQQAIQNSAVTLAVFDRRQQ
ncbi:hypothetical protein [Roseisolibacter agri]|uniref:Uncharacterized protein n=1 Tax=Roseisolibacter agri TaxID=2014610 RepID=A0AA37V304_9BACT|nr:hypothetical protein [Roseisolibacter agri]GLC25917.1 hypothetical protein rosag_24300 [Roseisolibacter agri]